MITQGSRILSPGRIKRSDLESAVRKLKFKPVRQDNLENIALKLKNISKMKKDLEIKY
jgi:hypothetical protein